MQGDPRRTIHFYATGDGPPGGRSRFSYRLTAREEMPGLVVVRVDPQPDGERPDGRFPLAALNVRTEDAEAALGRAAARVAVHHRDLDARDAPTA